MLIAILLVGLVAALGFYCFLRWIEGPVYTKTNRIDGKVVIVTGCNRGVGKEIALEMARRGGRVYMACMDYSECEEARLEIVKRSGNPKVYNRHLDLRYFDSVRRFVEKFNTDESHLDILINNAGIVTTDRASQTKGGYEPHLLVNHLGHFLLTNLLVDKLKASPAGRIVVVASIVYKVGRICKDDLHNEKATFGISGYCNSKLANVLFTRKLSKLLDKTNVTVNCLHPGCVSTKIAVNQKYILMIMKALLRTPRGGAQTSIFLALDPDMKGKTGGYYDRMTLENYATNALDDEMATWLWRKSEILVGLKESLLNEETTNGKVFNKKIL